MLTKKFAILCFVALGSALAAFLAFFALGLSNAEASPSRPVQLIGTWNQTSGMPGTTMTAVVSPEKIEIFVVMVGQNTSGLYWSGTLDTIVRMGPEFTLNSTGDTKLMATKLFASQDGSKTFTYKDGELSFQFSMLGVTSTVHLTRSSG